MDKYNESALKKICEEINISLETLLENAEFFVMYNCMNLYSEEGNNVGVIIKEHPNCNMKLGDLVYSDNGNCTGNLYKFYSAEPNKIKKYIPFKKNKGHTMSDVGYTYFVENITKLIKDDPPHMLQALNFIRHLLKQGNKLTNSIEISSKYYKLDDKLVASRNGSRVNYYRYACKI